MEFTRRAFLKSAAAAGAGAVVAGMVGCTSSQNELASTEGTSRIEPDETVQADICICGAGMSGLAAAVQAAQNGDKVVVLEAETICGSSSGGVEGIFGYRSVFQRELGMDFDISELVAQEIEATQYTTDGRLWLDLVNNSAENIDWLLENGCGIEPPDEGVYDGGVTLGTVPTCHWWSGGFASKGYIPPMSAKAQELGVEIRLQSRATSIDMVDGRVAGVFAETKSGILKVEAPVVILATGGGAHNEEFVSKHNWFREYITPLPGGCNAEGITMAEAVGARLKETIAYECWNQIGDPEYRGELFWYLYNISQGGPELWVNENAERFVDESCALDNFSRQTNPTMGQKEVYAIFDQAIFDAVCPETATDARKEWDQLVADSETQRIWVSDDLYSLADMAGLDSATLRETLDRYQQFCEQGKDEDFAKKSEYLSKFEQGPFYLCRMIGAMEAAIGGIHTDRHFRAVADDTREAIPGLYAVGVDGCMLYGNVYTIFIPCSCCGNSINSGRTAANDAHEFLQMS